MMLAPPGYQHADQVDVQEPGRRSRDLADGGLAGRHREVLQGTAKVHPGACGQNLAGQCLRRFLPWAEQQIQGSMRAVLHGWRHGRASSIVVMLVPGLGSMRTVCVTAVPVSWTFTGPGGPASATTRTIGSGADGGRERRRRRRTTSAPPAAAGTAAASKMTSAPGVFDDTGLTWNDCFMPGAAA